MPLLGFTKLKEKLLDGSKTQTIRKPRKHPLKVGDKLFIYWKLRTKQCEKLGEAVITNIVRKPILEVTEEEAIKDGFEQRGYSTARNELLTAFGHMHGPIRLSTEFDVITFEWTKRWFQIPRKMGLKET